MKLHINGEAFDVPPAFTHKLMDDLLKEGEKDYYEKVPKGWRILGQALARLVLEKMEKDAIPQIGKQAARDVLRPKDREDPNLLLAKVFSRIMLKGLELVDVYIATSDSGTIDTFNFTVEQSAGASGRQVDFGGDIGLRQDHGSQVS